MRLVCLESDATLYDFIARLFSVINGVRVGIIPIVESPVYIFDLNPLSDDCAVFYYCAADLEVDVWKVEECQRDPGVSAVHASLPVLGC